MVDGLGPQLGVVDLALRRIGWITDATLEAPLTLLGKGAIRHRKPFTGLITLA